MGDVYLLQLLLSGEAQAVHGVGPAVGPLAKLLGGFGEGHVGGDGAVDDGLAPWRIKRSDWSNKSIKNIKSMTSAGKV